MHHALNTSRCSWQHMQGAKALLASHATSSHLPSTGMPMVNLLATRAMIFLLTWRSASFLLKPCN